MASKRTPHLNVKLDKEKWKTEIIDLVNEIEPTWDKSSQEIKVSFFTFIRGRKIGFAIDSRYLYHFLVNCVNFIIWDMYPCFECK